MFWLNVESLKRDQLSSKAYGGKIQIVKACVSKLMYLCCSDAFLRLSVAKMYNL